MIKTNKKNKKKKGFTLVELIAVVAIIGILAAVLVPKVSGYIKESRKTAVIDQARKVVTAAESIAIKTNTATASNASVKSIADGSAGLVDAKDLKNLLQSSEITGGIATKATTYEDCLKILDPEKHTFEVENNGGLKLVS